ncbi:MAG TPA: c-type cytochrome [Acidobacteriaceae bacterium]|nr:c-type cytochrome [Acidobacteriaceae bacterium]
MKLRSHIGIWSLIFVPYVVIVLVGLGYVSLPALMHPNKPAIWSAWQAPDLDTIPPDQSGDSIRYGLHLFRETPWYAPQFTGNRLSCSDCHIGDGIAPYASPMVGLPALFPMYNKRAGHVISLKDRIQECFTRSENGRPLPYDGREMRALVAYIEWLSQPEPGHKPFAGRGLMKLPPMHADPKHGEQIYAMQCAGCHGADGSGSRPLMPALWGPESFNDGAGMNGISKMARFVQFNMPQNRRGMLSAQEAYDVAAYIHAQPRPPFNPAYKGY